jgi:chemotaxis protein MotA
MGVGSANVIYLPVANRLKAMSAEEVELRTLTLEGILAVQAGDNPRVVADKLTSYLPPAERNSDDDGGNVAEMPAAAEQEAA